MRIKQKGFESPYHKSIFLDRKLSSCSHVTLCTFIFILGVKVLLLVFNFTTIAFLNEASVADNPIPMNTRGPAKENIDPLFKKIDIDQSLVM
jgi:hypothetical protein